MQTSKISVESAQPMSGTIKVAFATKDMQTINAHFGGAKEFVVYCIGPEGFELSSIVKTDTSDIESDEKTEYKIEALKGVNIMYCESIGGTAAAKVIRAGMNPMKVAEPRPIKEVLEELLAMINGNPPPWIKRLMKLKNDNDPRLERWAE